ncbi:hypothetical protein I3760_13G164900 [Carya illinoinensis]|nr:hypothetical protein I3760_13G164900 [Carya illinoinensis]
MLASCGISSRSRTSGQTAAIPSRKTPSPSQSMAHQASLSSPILGLTPDLYHKLLDLLKPTPPTANFVSNVSSLPPFDNHCDWVVDNGATDHLCHDRSLFSSLDSHSLDRKVTLPNGHLISIEGVGTCVLADHIILHNVLFVPQFCFNLLSVPQLTHTNSCIIAFSSSTISFQDPHSMRLIGAGELCNGLYVYWSTPTTALST